MLLTLFLVVSASGQIPARPVDPKTKEALKELFKDVRNWAQSNVIPKMRECKGTLDDAMSPEDLQTLNALRHQATRLKGAGKKLAADVRAARLAKEVRKLRELRTQGRLLKEKRDEMLKNLKPLATKYKSTLQEIGKEARPLGKAWRVESKKMVKEWYEAHKSDFGPGFRKVFAQAVQRLRRMNGLDEDLKAKIAAAKFLLWDGKDLPEIGQALDDQQSDENELNASVPDGYSLGSNYPNPFNPITTINYQLPKESFVTFKVFDILGNQVAELVNGYQSAGNYKVNFPSSNMKLTSGAYFYELRAGDFVSVRKMLLMK